MTTVPPVVQHNPDPNEDQFADILFNVKSDVHDVASEISNKLSEGKIKAEEFVTSLQLAHSAWLLGLHQVLLFFLVLGRWMLPRGGIR